MIQVKSINIRTTAEQGSWKPVEMEVDSKQPECKFCEQALFVAPDGKTPYCNNWSLDHDKDQS